MFEKRERIGLVVYLYYNRDARKLNKYGDVIYHSRRLRYSVLYLDKSKAEEILAELSEMKFVKEVLLSPLDDINREFVGSLQNNQVSSLD